MIKVVQNSLPSRSTQLYLQPMWYSLFGGDFKKLILKNKNDEYIGELATYEPKIKGFSSMITPIFQSHNCLVFNSSFEKESSKVAFEKSVFEALIQYMNEKGAKIVDLAFPTSFGDMQVFQWRGFVVEPKYTYQIILEKDLDQLKAQLDSSTRSNLNKAEKDLTVRIEKNPSESLRLCDLTFSRQNEKYHRELLKKVLESEELDSNRASFFVFQGNDCIANVELVFDAECAYYLIGGYDQGQKHRGANTLAMWKAIEFALEKKITLFDFQGSMIPGVEKFIRGFGGKKKTYFRVKKYPWFLKLANKLRQ